MHELLHTTYLYLLVTKFKITTNTYFTTTNYLISIYTYTYTRPTDAYTILTITLPY